MDLATCFEQPVPLSYYRQNVDGAEALEEAAFALYAEVHRAAAVRRSTLQAALLDAAQLVQTVGAVRRRLLWLP